MVATTAVIAALLISFPLGIANKSGQNRQILVTARGNLINFQSIGAPGSRRDQVPQPAD